MHVILHPPLTLIFFAFACDVRGGGEVDSLIFGWWQKADRQAGRQAGNRERAHLLSSDTFNIA